MRRRVALIGAFDRFNYGDLLFPHIVEHELRRRGIDADYRCYSLRPADLRSRGGVLTGPLAELRGQRLPPGSAAIVAGGEVLSARWLDAWLGLAGPRRSLAAKVAARLVGTGVVDSACRRLLGGNRPLPWVVSGEDLGHDVPVLYNGVGGTGVDRLPAPLLEAARARLERAAFLSVRDPQTKAALDGWGLPVEVHLAPDCGPLVAKLWPGEAAADQASDVARRAVDDLGDGYLVFQVGRYPAWGLVPQLAEQLREIHRETGLAILLLPLGQAPGHEDVVPLERISGLLGDLPVTVLSSPDVADIVFAIANAGLFVGSSLHGNLTALAYGVPHVGFGARVAKLDQVLRTWDSTCPQGTVAPDRVAAQAIGAIEIGVAQRRRARDEAISDATAAVGSLAATIG
jgi:hypothetical protein